MQHNKYRNSFGLLLSVLVAAFVFAGCAREDAGTPQFSLKVTAFDEDGNEIDAEIVKDVTFYIFDKDKKFLDSYEGTLLESITFDYPDHEALTVVVWGNGRQGNQLMPTLHKGDHLETAFVSLIQTKTTLPLAGSPDDLFYGSIDMLANETSTKVLSLKRKTSGVVVTARYLKEYVGDTDGEFHYVLRKSSDRLDFYGKPNGADVSYSPDAAFDNTGDFVSSVFNIFSTDNDIKIDIYHRNVLKTTIVSDSQGKPLRAVEGRLLNVFVNFKGSVSVGVKVTDWGSKEIWKEF